MRVIDEGDEQPMSEACPPTSSPSPASPSLSATGSRLHVDHLDDVVHLLGLAGREMARATALAPTPDTRARHEALRDDLRYLADRAEQALALAQNGSRADRRALHAVPTSGP